MDGFLSGLKDEYHPWEYEGVSETAMDSFCDDRNRNFLQLHTLLSSFTNIDHVPNVADLKHGKNVLRGKILENRLPQNIDS